MVLAPLESDAKGMVMFDTNLFVQSVVQPCLKAKVFIVVPKGNTCRSCERPAVIEMGKTLGISFL